MKNSSQIWHGAVIFTITHICMGCAENTFTAPISSIDNNGIEYTPQIVDQHTAISISNQTNSPQGNAIRNYNVINKGCYSGSTYKVKHGDTLFYISWITGYDYQDLAKRNNIQKPYRLNVGQILQVSNNVITASIPTTVKSTKLMTSWHWPTHGKIVDSFSHVDGGNKGIDISGFQGQPILASANGRVVYIGNALRGYGNLVIIKHNNDYLSAYAHNNTILVSEQQEVRAGQKIATMGSIGDSSAKLHFEIRYKGKPVNPLHYLK